MDILEDIQFQLSQAVDMFEFPDGDLVVIYPLKGWHIIQANRVIQQFPEHDYMAVLISLTVRIDDMQPALDALYNMEGRLYHMLLERFVNVNKLL